jgi:FkbM family methyltransferase|uniref:Methyltransferase, FkbM family protein n=1 Tax=uncultured marine thaumarchaeote KM3_48_E01 TaxID=1456170 RepID=A0A075H9D5_9ARCH|nr:methyltransferase, FkbM family protein [uncultured marine thaumarchaeote KM3_48_E01]
MKIRAKTTDLMQLATIWLTSEYEAPGFEIKENDTIIDVGGHIGLFMLFCEQFCHKGKIYCFEPELNNYRIFSDNVKLNNLENIHSFNMAISKQDGNVPLYLNDDSSGHSIFLKNSNSIQVESITLQKVFELNNIKKCNLLKLDCEGSEYEIINSLPDSYFSMIDKIIIEYHFAKKYPKLLTELIKKLELMSFSINMKKLDDDMGLIFAIKNQ